MLRWFSLGILTILFLAACAEPTAQQDSPISDVPVVTVYKAPT